MSEQIGQSIRMFSPPCTTCVEKRDYRNNCLWYDWMDDHAAPHNVGGRYWKLQALMMSLQPWEPQSLIPFGVEHLIAIGTNAEDIASDLALPQHRIHIIERGIEKATEAIHPTATHREDYSTLEFNDNNGRRRYQCRYLCLPLPDDLSFTMIPLLIRTDYTTYAEADLRHFMYESHNELNIIGDQEAWNKVWSEFWKELGIIQSDWKKAHHDYWKTLWEGHLPDESVASLFNAVENRMKRLVLEHYDQWLTSRAEL